MITTIKTKLYQLQQHKEGKIAFIALLVILTLYLISKLSVLMIGVKGAVYPWSIVSLIHYGFKQPVLLATIITSIPMIAIHEWSKGGVRRAIANQIIGYWVVFVLLSTLALAAFITIEGMTLPSYPWLIYPLLHRMPMGSSGFNTLVVCLFVSYALLAGILVMKVFSAKGKAEKVFGNAHFASAFEIEKAGLFAPQGQGIVLGKAYGKPIRKDGYEGILVNAPTGAGKTTAIAIPNLIEWDGSGVFNDLKGELYCLTANYRERVLKNECYRWSPADNTDTCHGYNPFFYVSPDPDLRIRDLQLIAEILIPATKLGDGFWYQSSREIFLTLALYLLETTGHVTLGEIHDLSKQANFTGWLKASVIDQGCHFSKELCQNTNAYLGADKKTQKNTLKDFHSRMSLFGDPIVRKATASNDFDFREIRRKKMSIYINIPDADKERLSPILTLFWAQFINTMSDHEPSYDEPLGVLALMDEFGNMAKIDKLKSGMSFLRSYHVRAIIIVQYLGQIVSTYGREDAKGFLNSKVKVTFSLSDVDDANFFSKALGQQTVAVSSRSTNTGHGDQGGSSSQSISYQSRALMSPDELTRLPENKAVIMIESKAPIKAKKCYWFNEPNYHLKLNQVYMGRSEVKQKTLTRDRPYKIVEPQQINYGGDDES